MRPLSIANAPEPIRRLGCIAMNTPVEFDIYAHANSTLVGGTRMINGLGGSGDYLRNGYLKIMHSPSTRPSKTDPLGITCVVPKAPHIDHTEHDLDVLVTEQGLADLRGVAPKDRAKLIIEKCAHPEYKPILTDYLEMATKDCIARGVGHEPQLFDRAFKMQQNLADQRHHEDQELGHQGRSLRIISTAVSATIKAPPVYGGAFSIPLLLTTIVFRID